MTEVIQVVHDHDKDGELRAVIDTDRVDTEEPEAKRVADQEAERYQQEGPRAEKKARLNTS